MYAVQKFDLFNHLEEASKEIAEKRLFHLYGDKISNIE
jgi:hypothetical protein